MLIANKFISKLPKDEVPERTKGYEGFFHVHHLNGTIEETVLELIIRDHDKKKFEKSRVLLHLRERQAFMKPSVRRRTEVLKAVYKQQLAAGKFD